MDHIKVLAINPGSTSTKIALSEDFDLVFEKNIKHDAKDLAKFEDVLDQYEYRKKAIEGEIEEAGYLDHLKSIDAVSSRCGGFRSMLGGVYEITDEVVEGSRMNKVKHPSVLGSVLGKAFADEYGVKAYMLNTPDTDEYDMVSRMTGVKGVYRTSAIHALNQKEVAYRYAEKRGEKYEDLNLIICHIGGGISVTAHKKGMMVDSNDIVRGEGPMAPTRSGAMPAKEIVNMCFSGEYTEKEMNDLISNSGGLVSHLGTSDAIEVDQMIEKGDLYAKLVYDAMIYQIAKEIGSMAVVLSGKVDGMIFTGGIANDKYVVKELGKRVGFLGPIEIMAGEFEMEALVAGAVRVIRGDMKAKEFSKEPYFSGLDIEKMRKGVVE